MGEMLGGREPEEIYEAYKRMSDKLKLVEPKVEPKPRRPAKSFVDGDGLLLFGNHYLMSEIVTDESGEVVISFKATRCTRKECHDLK